MAERQIKLDVTSVIAELHKISGWTRKGNVVAGSLQSGAKIRKDCEVSCELIERTDSAAVDLQGPKEL